ncbi:YjbH domain-containing protein [Niveispirillum sp.]|uniref:YjbH domain-containing protein n=1 Tax=Niveispirillum sp. TaxID=1917217 RepID=UPI001B653C10|nr:YjbH domain-containing protein [Niveispirillum sp.]MBP7334740.1 YjbH domain-containing protein [Niveispirillum sp.]
MRLLPVLFLLLLPALACRADTPPADQPTAFLPTIGSAWMSLTIPEDGFQVTSFGLRPIRALSASLRQGDRGLAADFALELLEQQRFMPALVLDSRGHGDSVTGRLDSLLLGSRMGKAELSAGLGRDGTGDLRPVVNLRLPIRLPALRSVWLSGGVGGPDEPVLEAGWAVEEAGSFVTLGWRRDRGLVGRTVIQFDGAGQDEPWFRRTRRPDGGRFTDIGLSQSPGAAFRAALPDPDPPPPRVTLSSHRLGLPGVATSIAGSDIDALRRHRISPAEIRRNSRFRRAETPDSLSHHWELQLDALTELEPGPRGYAWATRASAGARLHLLPFAGLILTGEGRAATAVNIGWPRWEPPSAGRDDAALYLHRRFSLDRAQAAFVRALTPSLDMLLEAGNLDPLYGGGGGELRYQPLRARWSLGTVIHHVWKRPPTVQTLYRGTGRTTGFLTGGWEGQDGGIRSELALGRYLAGDWGCTYTLSRQFGTGVTLSLDATATTGSSRLGLTLTLPLIGFGQHVEALTQMRVRPMARENAERLDRALTLSDLRFAAGYARVTRDWDRGLLRVR